MELSVLDIIDDITENKKELSILTLSSPSLSLLLVFFSSPLFPLSSSFNRNHILWNKSPDIIVTTTDFQGQKDFGWVKIFQRAQTWAQGITV